MDPLRIKLLGAVEVTLGEVRLPAFPTHKSKALFSLLLLHRGRCCPRQVLMGNLWGDRPEAEARKALRTALWRVRSVLEPTGIEPGTYLCVRADEVGFNWDADHWLDAQEMEARVREARAAVAAGQSARAEPLFNRAVELYGGPLLEGHYEEWSLGEAERLRALYLLALEHLVSIHLERGKWHLALRRGTELLRHDSLREHVHRDLIRCEYARGNRPGALKRYERCRRLLEDELGVEPMRETRDLMARILDEVEPEASVQGRRATMTSEGSVQDLSTVADELERLARRIRQGPEPRRRRRGAMESSES